MPGFNQTSLYPCAPHVEIAGLHSCISGYLDRYSLGVINLNVSLSITNNESAADSLHVSEDSVMAIKNAMTVPNEFKFEINIYSYSNELINSIKTKLMILDENIRIYPGHMDSSTIGYEKLRNPFLQNEFEIF